MEVVKGKILEREFNKNLPGLKNIFTPVQIEGIKEFIAASQRAQMSGTMINPASGRQMLAWAQVGAAVGFASGSLEFITGQDYGDRMLYAGTAVFGPDVLAKALINPRMARLLARGMEMSAKTGVRSGYSVRMVNILRKLQEESASQEQAP